MTNDEQKAPAPSASAPATAGTAAAVPAPPETSIAGLLSGIVADAQQLIQQQFAMFRQEIRNDVGKIRDGSSTLALGAGITLVGSILFLLMVPLLLHAVVPALPLWACFGMVGGPLAALGGFVMYVGLKKLESFDPLSDQSAKALKENWKWTSNPK